MISWRSNAPSGRSACVFVDRDGVINERIVDGYVLDWAEFRFRPDALAALRRFAAAGLPVVVVSIKKDVGRGLLTPEALVGIMRRMQERLVESGAPLLAWYCCPHTPADGCECRKPGTLMLRQCAQDFGFDLRSSYLVGDSPSDIAAGEAVGCTCFTVDPNAAGGFEAAAEAIVTREKAVDAI